MIVEYLSLDFLMLGVGCLGALGVGLNYILEAMNKLSKDHKIFSWINFGSSIALLSYSWYNAVWLFVVLNLFLTIIGIIGLYEVYFKN